MKHDKSTETMNLFSRWLGSLLGSLSTDRMKGALVCSVSRVSREHSEGPPNQSYLPIYLVNDRRSVSLRNEKTLEGILLMKKGKSHSGKRWRDDDRWSIDSGWSGTAMIYAASGCGSFALNGDYKVSYEDESELFASLFE
jgi:hypothetical protein